MTQEWEERFAIWARPPSQTSQQKAARAESVIQSAIEASNTLQLHRVSVFSQGSYRNRTNVRDDSDVDICVYCGETCFFDLPAGKTAAEYGISIPARYPYPAFRNDVQTALHDYLGWSGVTRGNKAFDVHENTYRIDADAIPCVEYQWYPDDGGCVVGTAFFPDNARHFIHNFPEQNYENGVAKNNRTSRRFKAVVRVLKTLCYEMQSEGFAEAKRASSYLIECLAWNVADDLFMRDTLAESVGAVVADIWTKTVQKNFVYHDWYEINGIKYLFHGSQPWTYDQVNAFALVAWNYVGFA